MKDKKPKKEVPQLDFDFIQEDDWKHLMMEWSEYHKDDIKKPYKQRGIQAAYSLLKRLSSNNIEMAYLIVEQSEACNYQGLFPLKQEYGRQFNQASTDKQSKYKEEFFGTIARKMGE